MRHILLLLLFCSPCLALAPPPMRLNGEIELSGKKQVEIFWIEGKIYEVSFEKDVVGIKELTGKGPPKIPYHFVKDGDFNGREPFKYGDLVQSKLRPDYGILFVTECKKKKWSLVTTWMVSVIYSKNETDHELGKYENESTDFYLHFDPEKTN